MQTPAPSPVSTGARILDWPLRILLALAFIAAGGAKLAGAPPMVAIFDQIGIGQWFRLLTGALEIAGGLLALAPRTSIWGALLLACVMVGALFTHLVLIGGNPLPALVLLVLTASVLWLRRAQFAAAVRGQI